ncbi:LysR family transcriptional regulator (chromosome initiation inhibitor) [Nocardia transvalensis]|uniref:LysR family transcriptional regulator (Chromosome initiation inhibitor) n=1 Tax=Nocardia transvalensis TaxID=37333 RepID=A0A7W9UHC6_9NOCA|nr:LysR family transcriptional regulator ArgP [Nocardia transvalensis]MBB5913188.1 LysR family transcriptional regulator (chromosome initiation inhibitor) [Nocardia transvalensis]
MDLQLDQLRALDAAVAEGTLEAAAHRLSVTPSAVSQRIKALEGTVGRILLKRTKPVRPTESGLAVLRLARQIELLSVDTARELGTTASESDPSAGQVRIPVAVNADSLETWVIPALVRAPAGVCFEIHREDEEHTTRLLRDGTVMAAITATAQPVQGCKVERLGAMRYRPMATPHFARTWFPEGPTVQALATAPVVLFDRKDDLQDRLLRRRARRPLDPPRHYIPSSTGFAEAVRLGLGWGMLPDLQSATAENSGALTELGRNLHIDVPLYWQQWRLDSPALSAVAALISEAATVTLR